MFRKSDAPCGTFAILAHSLSFVKHFLKTFSFSLEAPAVRTRGFRISSAILPHSPEFVKHFFRSSMAFVNQHGSNPLGVSESQPCYLSTSRTVCQELFSEAFQVRHLSGSSCRSLAPTALIEYQIPAHLSTPFSKFFQEIQKFLICPRIQRNQGRKLKKSSVQTTAFVLYWNRTSIPRFSLKYERRKLEC